MNLYFAWTLVHYAAIIRHAVLLISRSHRS
jgi:hypothetical protein